MLKTKLVKGKGYFFFPDKANRRAPQMYKDKGFTVKHSQLCVTGDTKILTQDGYKEISTLAGKVVSCWNGKEFSDTAIAKTGDNSHVQEVILSNGMSIKATDYHKWYRLEKTASGKRTKPPRYEEIRTVDLKEGDKLIKFDLEPVTHGTKELDLAYVNGFHSADGTVYKCSGKPRISIHDDKQLLAPRFSGYYSSSYSKGGRILNLHYKKDILKDKFFVPSCEYSVASRIKWLEGYLDGDGTLTDNNGTESIQVASVEKTFLQEVLLLLQELGINSKVTKAKEAGYNRLPANDGTGELKEFWTKELHRLLIPGTELPKLLALGYNAGRVQPTKRRYARSSEQFVKVLDVVDTDEYAPVYCGNEPKDHKLMFNGVLTGNCSEIVLFNDKDHTYTCVLASVNAAKYDEWKDTNLVKIATVFLDCVISDFLDKAKGKPGFKRAVRFTERTKAIGLGVMGLSTYYQMNNWIFGDVPSSGFNVALFRELSKKTLDTSKWLAKELGEPEYMQGYGERFSHRMAVAPTMSTSTILGGISAGIEPVTANIYEQDTAGGTVFRINPVFLDLMKERGMYTKEVMDRIANDNGSVQAEDWLTEHEKKVFRTAYEVSQYDIIRMASSRQPYIDQGQSTNLYFQADAEEEYIADVHDIAFKDENILSLYYVRSLNKAGKVKIPVPNCEMCDG